MSAPLYFIASILFLDYGTATDTAWLFAIVAFMLFAKGIIEL